ncbi:MULTISPECIES: hypothetical protein [unclassified Methylobacterium]|uniref:hypothetical protein n=1 Tax=unclassified Methylobacterium TaxID=2615210 RepID=UPI000EBCA03A|nr:MULTISPECIES: hypothetical protein [unclassified Methylobacterium]GBU16254.1 hypothetical protein AwMethylo_04690 [Methylobacterium sp.]
MASRSGLKGVRAAFSDALAQHAADAQPSDPPAEENRHGFPPGGWPGGPVSHLPPECPVIPLGKDGDTTYFVDTLGQLRAVNVNRWGKKILLDLFAHQPNYLTWAWPRLSAPKDGKPSRINGLEVDDACACLLKAASSRGLFAPVDRVRGRGAWIVKGSGELVWHSGQGLWRVSTHGKLQVSRPGEVDGTFYPRRPPVLEPWREAVPAEQSPAHDLIAAFQSWKWERPLLDPILLLGWIGAAFLGAALDWRPALFITGDYGQGKSTLQAIIKEVIGDALHATADTTPAGIYQRVKQDCLPVAVDELEADADNRRAVGVVRLARLAASGGVMYRGGSEHEGVEFQARNAFFFSAINPPPLGPQDRSRMALLNLRKLEQGGARPEIPGAIDTFGRQFLRQLMDGWKHWPRTLNGWKDAMRDAGLDGRTQDTYGTLLACATMLLGDAGMEAAGLPVTEPGLLGPLIAEATAAERGERTANWRACLEHLLASPIEAWKGGEKPTVGGCIELLEANHTPLDTLNKSTEPLDAARTRLALAGLGLVAPGKVCAGPALAIPATSPLLTKLFAGTIWGAGVWMHALKQGPADVVIRDRGNAQVVKINRVATRCVLVDMQAFDTVTKVEDEG